MSLTERVKQLITSKHLVGGTAVASLLESTVIPIPLEPVLIPAMQANRDRLWRLATAALAGCMAGAILGYGIGYWLFEAVGRSLVSWFGSSQQFEDALEQVRSNGFWFVLSVGIVPIPFQIAMLAAGAAGYSILGYMAATLLSRGIRYYGLAFLVWRFGDRAQDLYHRHRWAVTAAVTALVIGAWIVTAAL